MTQFNAGRIEGDGFLRKLRRRREDEYCLVVDEALDEPCRCNAIHMRARAGDPAPTAKLAQVEGWFRLGACRFSTSGAHGEDLLETPDFGAAWGSEEVDAA